MAVGVSLVVALLALAIVAEGAAVAAAAAENLDFARDCGGVQSTNTFAVAKQNAQSLAKCLARANPHGSVTIARGQTFYWANMTGENLVGVSLHIDGTLILNNNIDKWPKVPGARVGALGFRNCTGLTIDGTGVVDGQGYDWWWHVILEGGDWRPYLFVFESCSGLRLLDVTARNAPQMHFRMKYVEQVHVRSVTVFVDVEGQRAVQQHYARTHQSAIRRAVQLHADSLGARSSPLPVEAAKRALLRLEARLLRGDIPTFPLNTDGFDPAGRDMLFENITVTNFDDAVAVKPLHDNGHSPLTCSENFVIRDSTITYSVGMTIGSVGPSIGKNCVRNVTFQDITMNDPIKGIYIKTDPGDRGDGIIDRITYRRLKLYRSLWYPIWIGPQQQHQPHRASKGCSFFYPIDQTCPTQPRVPITNIVLEDITATRTELLPGVLLCNATKPCTNFEFTDVVNSGLDAVEDQYVSENVVGGVASGGTKPVPPGFKVR